MSSTRTPSKLSTELGMAPRWEELLAEMRAAHEHGVPGVGARAIATVERTLARVERRERENPVGGAHAPAAVCSFKTKKYRLIRTSMVDLGPLRRVIPWRLSLLVRRVPFLMLAYPLLASPAPYRIAVTVTVTAQHRCNEGSGPSLAVIDDPTVSLVAREFGKVSLAVRRKAGEDDVIHVG